MTTHPKSIERPAHADCQLAHHATGSAVTFHEWRDDQMVHNTGTVLKHEGRRITISVFHPVKRVVETECGHVAKAGAAR